VLDTVPLDRLDAWKARARAALASRAEPVLARIEGSGELGDADRAELVSLGRAVAAEVGAS
jgi:hypothetical protein